MTRIALLSDIHGNLPALERVMADMKQFAPDQVVVAGDMVNWGPFSAEVLQVVYDKRWTMIRGNNEYYCINAVPPRKPESWAEYTLLEWLHGQLTDWHHVIAGLPDDLLLLYPDAPDVHVCHGIPGNCWTGIYSAEFSADETVNEWVSGGRAKTIFGGHTHIPLNRVVGQYHILNPGSVGVPLLGEPVSSYMILDGTAEGWELAHHRTLPWDMSKDLSALQSAWEAQRFVERCGVAAQMVIKEFEQARIVVHSFNTWMKQAHPNKLATFEDGDAFLKIDASPYIPEAYHPSKERQYLN
jgi:predicted phosphodiesterase